MMLLQGVVTPGPTDIVTGRVLQLDGRPAADVRIAVQAAADSPAEAAASPVLAAITTTDKDGRYSLENVPQGRYYVLAGPLSSPTYYPGVSALDSARLLTIQPTLRVSNLDFRLLRESDSPRSYTNNSNNLKVVRVQVTATDASHPGGLIVSASITPAGAGGVALLMDLQGVIVGRSSIGPDGLAEFRDIKPGIHKLQVATSNGTVLQRINVRAEDALVKIP